MLVADCLSAPEGVPAPLPPTAPVPAEVEAAPDTFGVRLLAGEEEAVLARLEAVVVAFFLACLALAENLDREKSPKSESESLSLN